MKHIPLLLILLFAVLGCGEGYDRDIIIVDDPDDGGGAFLAYWCPYED